jgi:hypothetical protein
MSYKIKVPKLMKTKNEKLAYKIGFLDGNLSLAKKQEKELKKLVGKS